MSSFRTLKPSINHCADLPDYKLEHIGLAVSNANQAIEIFQRLLGTKPYKTETVGREGVHTYFIGDEGVVNRAPKLELLESNSEDSAIASFLKKRGEGIHHIAFEVDDIRRELRRLASAGFQLISNEPKPGADGKLIAFLHPRTTAGVLVELCQQRIDEQQLRIPYRDGSLAGFVSGPADAPPLIVLHAALGSTELETRRLTRIWAEHFRVYALDFMAHGESDWFEDAELSLPLFAENVLALMDHAELNEANLFGFSLGASTALQAAVTYPERFSRLGIHAHNVQWNDKEVELMTSAMQSTLDNLGAHWAKRLSEIHGEQNWRQLVERMLAFTKQLPARQIPEADLSTIDHPTLVSAGDSDQFFGLRHSLMLHQSLNNSSLAILPGMAHPIQTANLETLAAMYTKHFTL